MCIRSFWIIVWLLHKHINMKGQKLEPLVLKERGQTDEVMSVNGRDFEDLNELSSRLHKNFT